MHRAASATGSRALPVTRLMRSVNDEPLRGPRLASLIAVATALLVLTLACVGIAGVVDMQVSRN
jgi:hypothetical protein